VIYRLWERFTLYLPVALMAVLALISYWLVRTAPGDKQPEAVAVHDNAPDYTCILSPPSLLTATASWGARCRGLLAGISPTPSGPKSRTFMAKVMARAGP
jgi:hypothetical protein